MSLFKCSYIDSLFLCYKLSPFSLPTPYSFCANKNILKKRDVHRSDLHWTIFLLTEIKWCPPPTLGMGRDLDPARLICVFYHGAIVQPAREADAFILVLQVCIFSRDLYEPKMYHLTMRLDQLRPSHLSFRLPDNHDNKDPSDNLSFWNIL
jgi:hypothetical protein